MTASSGPLLLAISSAFLVALVLGLVRFSRADLALPITPRWHPKLRTRLLAGGILALGYLMSTLLGMTFASISGYASPVWPASAVALAGLLLLGVGYWPGVYLARFVASLAIGAPIWVALVVAAGVSLEAIVGAWLLRRLGFHPSIDSPRDVVRLWLVGGLAAAVSPTLGVLALRLAGMVPVGSELVAWHNWYMGDAAGMCLFTPALLALLGRPRPAVSTARMWELAILLTATAAASFIAFDPGQGYPYLPFIALAWVVFRFDMRVTALICALVVMVAIWETSQGRSQFGAVTPRESLVQLYRFVLVFGGVGLFLGAFAESQRVALADLRSSEERFRIAFRGSPIPKALSSLATGRIVEVNDSFLDLFGPSSVGFHGDINATLWVHQEQRERFLELARRGPVPNFEAELYAKAGGTRNGLVSAQPVDIFREPHLLVNFQDLTEYHQLHQQFLQSQKLESIGRLAGGVAHDFNNLITVILCTVDLALPGLAPEDPLRSDLVEVRRVGHRSAQLVRQLLAFSRRQVLEVRTLNLNTVLADAERLLVRLIGEDIKLVVVPGVRLGNVRADASQLEQVIMNLTINARDAMPTGGKLTLETANVELDESYASQHAEVVPGPYVMLAVSDTGAGMDSLTRDRIFEPFFTTKEVGQGTGLGLSTVYGIIKQHRGSIEVYSEPGAGSTFKVYLPLELEAELEASTVPIPVSLEGTETVLLVEDEQSIRGIVHRILTAKGYTVLVAATPTEALQLAVEYSGSIHLLLTDVVMPEMRGPELATRVLGLRPTMRVLYMSGYTANAIIQNGVLEPGRNLLEKPFEIATLLRIVREVLDAEG